MATHTASPRRPSPKSSERDCRNHFPVAARRQTAANFSPPVQTAALCRDAATPGNNVRFYSDVPSITSLGWRAVQKSPISRILPHNPTSSRLLPPLREGGWRILYSIRSFVSPCVGLCRHFFPARASSRGRSPHRKTRSFPAYSRIFSPFPGCREKNISARNRFHHQPSPALDEQAVICASCGVHLGVVDWAGAELASARNLLQLIHARSRGRR